MPRSISSKRGAKYKSSLTNRSRLLQLTAVKRETAHGFYELGMHNDAWTVLDELPPEDKAHRLDVY